jgi:hypothetical protein
LLVDGDVLLWIPFQPPVAFRVDPVSSHQNTLVQADSGLEVADASVSCPFHWKP